MNDFRIDSFEKVFAASLDEIEKIDKNFAELSDNQRLRAQQLLQNTQDNKERIENSIRTYSENWSYERIGKVEIIILSLGISELIMDLTPKKVIISEWVKLCDKHSSSQSAKFVNGILNTISENITTRRINIKNILPLDDFVQKTYDNVVIEINGKSKLDELQDLLREDGKTKIKIKVKKEAKVYTFLHPLGGL